MQIGGHTMIRDKALTGAAGAYYIGFRLSALGYAVGLTTHGTRAIDLFVANPDTGKSITIQTKTMGKAFVQSKKYGPYWKWPVGKTPPSPYHTFFYAFVDLRDDPSQTPDVFIVPSVRLDSLLEKFPNWYWCTIEEDNAPEYKNRWDIIKDALA
jgi:hypothetical protein